MEIIKHFFVKIDTVFFFEVEDTTLTYIENHLQIYDMLREDITQELYFLFEQQDNTYISHFRITKKIKELILNLKINNFVIADFTLYLHSLNKEMLQSQCEDYVNLENLYKDFIIHLNTFRKDQILKYTFNIKQRRVSRKKLFEIRKEIKNQNDFRNNWKAEELF